MEEVQPETTETEDVQAEEKSPQKVPEQPQEAATEVPEQPQAAGPKKHGFKH